MKILFVADIGSDDNGYYHVGDESMFYYNRQALLCTGKYEIYYTTRFISNKDNNTSDILGIDFSVPYWRTIKILLLLVFLPFFSKKSEIGKLREITNYMDIIIISGGGNINSLWSGHLYFRFFICFLARKFGKQVLISSQTIGPLSGWIDRWISKYIIHSSEIIFLRDESFSTKFIERGERHKIKFGYDDALQKDRVKNTKEIFQKDIRVIYCGISIHESPDKIHFAKIITILKSIYEYNKNVRFVVIPHVLNKDNFYDIAFSEKILGNIKGIRYQTFTYDKLSEFAEILNLPISLIIEKITAQMDLVVTTRYHGGVFAIKNIIPGIFVGRDDYEVGKFRGLFESIGIKHRKEFIFDLRAHIDFEKRTTSCLGTMNSLKEDLNNKITTLSKSKFFINYFLDYDKNSLCKK